MVRVRLKLRSGAIFHRKTQMFDYCFSLRTETSYIRTDKGIIHYFISLERSIQAL
jgi:hypothetical protein